MWLAVPTRQLCQPSHDRLDTYVVTTITPAPPVLEIEGRAIELVPTDELVVLLRINVSDCIFDKEKASYPTGRMGNSGDTELDNASTEL